MEGTICSEYQLWNHFFFFFSNNPESISYVLRNHVSYIHILLSHLFGSMFAMALSTLFSWKQSVCKAKSNYNMFVRLFLKI